MNNTGHPHDIDLPQTPIRDRLRLFIANLPVVPQNSIPNIDDTCPICLMSFATILTEESRLSTPEFPVELDLGITKLVGCGHLFCRKDLAEWIRNMHGSCPTCRHIFYDIQPPSDSDDESSDGGEYIPDEDEEEEDVFLDTDGFSDAGEFEVDEMDLDLGDIWDDEDEDMQEDWGLTDGESLSEDEFGISGEIQAMEDALEVDIDVSINGEDVDETFDSDGIVPDDSK